MKYDEKLENEISENKKIRLKSATVDNINELYELQLISFESEAEMIGSREVPALQETKEDYANDFKNWQVLKLINDENLIVGAIRYRINKDVVEVGRVMIHPNYRRKGLAQLLLNEVDKRYPNNIKELYTCTKSWTNIHLYEKVDYKQYKIVEENNGLSFVYMRKK